jgi:hypothetical protein
MVVYLNSKEQLQKDMNIKSIAQQQYHEGSPEGFVGKLCGRDRQQKNLQTLPVISRIKLTF